MLLNKRAGYTLLEIVIVTLIFSIVLNMILVTLDYVTGVTSDFFKEADIYDNGKLTIEFLKSEIERNSYIDIYVDENNSLKKITIYKDSNKIYKDANTIKFYKEGNGIRNNSLYFGGVSDNNISYENRFSRYIEEIKITFDNNIISIKVQTMGNDKYGNDVFISKINVSNKNINFFQKKY